MMNARLTSTVTIVAMLGLCGFAGPSANAADKAPPARAFRIQKASDLIGKAVLNPAGERLGEVQDLAMDPDRGRVAYVVLSFGGFLGMGEKWFAVPTGALMLPEDCKNFVLSVDKDTLKRATGFEKDKWPQMGDPAWGMDLHKFYGQRPYWMDENEASTPTTIRIQKASEMLGRKVQNNRGETLGEVKDLMIDPDRARVAYAVLSFGGFLGMGDKLFAIPSGVLQMPGTAAYVVLTVEKDQLKKATGFDKDNWPNLADPTLASDLHRFYGQHAYWAEDLRGGQYQESAAGKPCSICKKVTVKTGFVRDGQIYCCAGCANTTGCTCSPVATGANP